MSTPSIGQDGRPIHLNEGFAVLCDPVRREILRAIRTDDHGTVAEFDPMG